MRIPCRFDLSHPNFVTHQQMVKKSHQCPDSDLEFPCHIELSRSLYRGFRRSTGTAAYHFGHTKVNGEYVLGTPVWIAGSNARFSACENAENTK
jgi:hypothetical protein